jgi:hypothetical protein
VAFTESRKSSGEDKSVSALQPRALSRDNLTQYPARDRPAASIAKIAQRESNCVIFERVARACTVMGPYVYIQVNVKQVRCCCYAECRERNGSQMAGNCAPRVTPPRIATESSIIVRQKQLSVLEKGDGVNQIAGP